MLTHKHKTIDRKENPAAAIFVI